VYYLVVLYRGGCPETGENGYKGADRSGVEQRERISRIKKVVRSAIGKCTTIG
jgi:hypothetical protein